MRLRNPKDKDEVINSCTFFYNKEEGFSKEQPIHLEIGMGKGDFITRLAELDRDNIYIGIELSPPVLALAVKKLRRYEEDNNIKLDNLYFMSVDAIELSTIFETHQIEKIYLNFSDPWPKKKHAKRRLTSFKFLDEYKKVLKENGQIEFKTDNTLVYFLKPLASEVYGKNDIFALIIILKRLLSKVDFKMMMNEINYEFDKLCGKLSVITVDDVIDKMGFPPNYRDIMYMEQEWYIWERNLLIF